MKLKRISKLELKKMKTMVIIWKSEMISDEEHWYINEFKVRSYDNGQAQLSLPIVIQQ